MDTATARQPKTATGIAVRRRIEVRRHFASPGDWGGFVSRFVVGQLNSAETRASLVLDRWRADVVPGSPILHLACQEQGEVDKGVWTMDPITLLLQRRKNRLTQAELGRRIGVSHTVIYRWEYGKREIPPERVPEILDAISRGREETRTDAG